MKIKVLILFIVSIHFAYGEEESCTFPVLNQYTYAGFTEGFATSAISSRIGVDLSVAIAAACEAVLIPTPLLPISPILSVGCGVVASLLWDNDMEEIHKLALEQEKELLKGASDEDKEAYNSASELGYKAGGFITIKDLISELKKELPIMFKQITKDIPDIIKVFKKNGPEILRTYLLEFWSDVVKNFIEAQKDYKEGIGTFCSACKGECCKNSIGKHACEHSAPPPPTPSPRKPPPHRRPPPHRKPPPRRRPPPHRKPPPHKPPPPCEYRVCPTDGQHCDCKYAQCCCRYIFGILLGCDCGMCSSFTTTFSSKYEYNIR